MNKQNFTLINTNFSKEIVAIYNYFSFKYFSLQQLVCSLVILLI